MSDTDLTQYNGTSAFPSTATVGTNADIFLCPTDGMIVTADSNNALEAPVNKAIKRLKDLYLGIRRATIGDTGGAGDRKTFIGLETDGVGGLPSSTPSGALYARNNIVSRQGEHIANVAAAADQSALNAVRLAFTGVGSLVTSSNPPQGTTLKNQLRAVNIPKVSAYIQTVFNGLDFDLDPNHDGYGVGSVSIDPSNTFIDIEFTDNFINTRFSVTLENFDPNPAGSPLYPVSLYERTAERTVGSIRVYAHRTGLLAPKNNLLQFSIKVDGRQAT